MAWKPEHPPSILILDECGAASQLLVAIGLIALALTFSLFPVGNAYGQTTVVSLSLSDTPDPVGPGGQMAFTVIANNTGSVPRDIVLTMAYDPDTTFAVSDVAPDVGSTTQWTFANVPAGSGRVVRIEVTVGASVPGGTVLSTTATATDVTFGGSIARTATTLVQAGAGTTPLETSLGDTPDPVGPGGQMAYQLIVFNRGGVARDIVLTMAYDPSTTFAVSDVAPDVGSTTQWTLPNVPAGSSRVVRIEVTVGASVPIGTVLSATATANDVTFGGSAARSVTTLVQAGAATTPLETSLGDTPDPVGPGGQMAYQLIVFNRGGVARDIVLTVAYDPSTTFAVSDVAPDVGSTTQWTLPNVAAGSSRVVRIEVTVGASVPTGTVLSATATANDVTFGGSAARTVTTLVQAGAATTPLDLSTGDTPDPVEPGARVAYQVIVNNRGGVARDIVLTMLYDPSTSFAVSDVPPDAGSTTQWTFPNVNAGSGKVVRIEVTVGSSVPDGTVLSATSSASDVGFGGSVNLTATTTVRWCAGVPNGTTCIDGLFCNGADTCNNGICSGHAGNPCAGGSECADACNEAADNCFDPGGTACQADGSPCTIDACDGAGTCAHDPGNPGLVCRAAAGDCDVAEACDGVQANCPADGFAAASVTCRAATGVCDLAESCTGTSSTCPGDGFQPASTTCRVAAGACDVAESCTGASATCPSDGFEAAATICRNAAGVCDVVESCTGTSASCPSDGFQPSATVCRVAAGDCDVAESCTGASAGCPADAFAPPSTECRASAGDCDAAESCTGTSAGCPSDGFQASATVCRVAAGDCDVAESCSGVSAACPADAFLASSTVCRASAGECDAAESCTGTGASCPSDGFQPSATVCRVAAGDCDVAESCTGASAGCPADAFAPSSTECRASAGDCDAAESCTGTGASCPSDGFQPSATVCRVAAGDCDVAESCSGVSAACPTDSFAASSTVCRASGGDCDVAESCTGTSAICPDDGFQPSTSVCRTAAGDCDVAESCSGVGAACPADAFSASSTVCRASGGECDVAETCSGADPSCPSDGFAVPGTSCSDDGIICTADECDGSGVCTHPAGNAASVCRASAGPCDIAEVCDGASSTCPGDSGLPDSDGDQVCDAQDACTNVGDGQDFKLNPVPKTILTKINTDPIAGNDKLSVQGVFDLAAGQSFAALNPVATGARVQLLNQAGDVELDVSLPGGLHAGRGTRGWKTNGAGTRWQYVDSTKDGTVTSVFGGVFQFLMIDRSKKAPREVMVKVQGKAGTYTVTGADSPVQAIVVLGGQDEAAAGLCGETAFLAASCAFNGTGSTLKCQQR